jgi:hypothetical protein
MGRNHIPYKGAELLAVCDVDKNHLQLAMDRAKEEGYQSVKAYSDFREVLARKDIDIVHVPTPPHWHAYITCAAADAGKDVWCEKPMSRTIGEGLKMVDAIQRNGRMFRINTFIRLKTMDFYGMKCQITPLKKIAMHEVLGWPLKITIGALNGFEWKLKMWSGEPGLREEKVPDVLDYDMWLGPAPYKPYNHLRVHEKFRGYWDYDGGGLGDMAHHYVDPVQYILGKDNTSPIEVEAEGPVQDADAVGTWDRIWMRYADGCEIVLDGRDIESTDAPFMEGPKGKIYSGLRSDIPNLDKILASLPDPEPYSTDFLESVRTREKFCLNESSSHRSCTLINIAKIAVRTLRPLRFDPDKFQFINDDEANRLINEPARAPWAL